MIEKWGINMGAEYWKNKRPSEREFTKIILNNLIVYKENGKYYFGISNGSLTDDERRIIKAYAERR